MKKHDCVICGKKRKPFALIMEYGGLYIGHICEECYRRNVNKRSGKQVTIMRKIKKMKKILGWFIEANSLLFWGPWKEMKV